MQQQSNTQPNTQQQCKLRKNKYEFTLDRGRKIYIDSDFDSGNIGLIRQVTQLQYRLQAVSDSKLSSNMNNNNNSENNNKNSNINNNNHNNNGKKTWFHFKISAPKNIRVRLIIQNVSIYENMYQDKDWAKPVMNDGTGNGWREVKDCFLTYRGEVGIIIDYTFSSQKFVFFAMTVPFSYEDNQNFVKQLAFKIPEHIQYSDQIIGKSYGGLNLHLLRFTSKQSKNTKQPGNSSSISNILQNPQLQKPQKKSNPRVHSQASIDRTIQPVTSLQSYNNNNNNNINNNFNPKKPIIFITSRVHPGEVGSSHCLLGIIDFLLQGNSLQAYLILKMFQIMIIPIVNPDGVYDGNYRMDLNNTNLNRVYQQPSEDQHPTVYKIKQLIQSLVSSSSTNNNDKLSQQLQPRKIMFHFDLHSHSCIKPAFIYGNAFDQIVTQTQSELFCRVLENNCAYFRYGLSHFGEKHMKMKDRGEILSKQGCARVVISKMANVVYSYTVQTSIFPYPQPQTISQPPLSSSSLFKIAQHPLLPQRDLQYTQINPQQIFNKYNIKNQLVLDNMNLGYSIMISILDILQKNPYARQILGVEEGLDGIRKEISQGLLQSQERFKLLDMKAYQKVRNIAKYCKDQITSKNQKCWDYLANDKILSSVKWPTCFKMFQPSPSNFDLDANRRRNRTKTQISESQRQVNQFINPRNMRKRLLNLQTVQNNQQCLNNNGQQQQKSVKNTKTLQNQPVSPSKSTLSPRHVQIQFDIKPTTTINTGTGGQQQNHHGHSLHSNSNSNTNTNHILPQIRRSLQRNTNSNNSNKIKLSSYTNNNKNMVQQQQEISAAQLKQMKQMKQLKQLKQKQSTKNIMQKINTIRKNVQKSMAVQSRLASYKLVKKSTKSSKALANIGSINMAANHRYQAYNNNIGNNNNNNCQLSQRVIYDHGQRDRQGDRKIKRSISRKKLTNNKNNGDQYQAIISTRRRNHTCIQQDQQQQFQQQQGIYYVDENNHQLDQKQLQIIQKSQKRRYTQQSQQCHSHSHHIHHQIPATKPRPPRMPASLQKISQYPLYPLPIPIPISIQKQKDNIAIIMGNKRELAKVKYSEIKKKNIIRQDISNNINSIYNNNNNNGNNNNGNSNNNNMVRLPQLRGVAANSSNNSNYNHNQSRNAGYIDNNPGEQTNNNNNINSNINNGQSSSNSKSGKNGLSINLNLNFNFNLQIESAVREITGRARAATVPDQL